jgi:hypothetical protein
MSNLNETAEQKRLNEAREQKVPWKKWGSLPVRAPVGNGTGGSQTITSTQLFRSVKAVSLSRVTYQAVGLVKVPVASLNVAGSCAAASAPLTNLLNEVDMRQKGPAGVFLRIEDTDLLAVGIIRQHHAHFKAPHVSIVQQVRCKVSCPIPFPLSL